MCKFSTLSLAIARECVYITYGPKGRKMASKSSRDVIKDLLDDGWELVRVTGSHHHFKHPGKPGLVTVPHPKRDLHPKTLASVYKAAGLPKPK